MIIEEIMNLCFRESSGESASESEEEEKKETEQDKRYSDICCYGYTIS